jgi:hypothetical protein
MKLPQIQENFIKTLQGTSSRNTQEANVGGNKGKGNLGQNTKTEKITPKKQSVFNVSLIGKRSKSTTPPFLLTFEIFNRNVHNCMVNSIAPSNVMPLKVCEKLNARLEKYDIQII